MRAVRYEAPGDFAVTDVPMPQVGPLEVRIRIHQTGCVAPTCTCTMGHTSASIRLPRGTRRLARSMRSELRSRVSAPGSR